MNRREFFRLGLGGAAAAAGALALPDVVLAGEKRPAPGPIDPDDLSKAAIKHFLPDDKTCSESILMASCEAMGIRSELVPDIALGLAGGIGLQGKTCGCVTSAAMAVGLAVAAKHRDYNKKKAETFSAAARLYKDFERKFGTTECHKLCGLDLTTPEGRKALAAGVKADKCRKLVDAAARLLAAELEGIRKAKPSA